MFNEYGSSLMIVLLIIDIVGINVYLIVYWQVCRVPLRILSIGERRLVPTRFHRNHPRHFWLWCGKLSKMSHSSSSKWPPSSLYFYLSFPPAKKVRSIRYTTIMNSAHFIYRSSIVLLFRIFLLFSTISCFSMQYSYILLCFFLSF